MKPGVEGDPSEGKRLLELVTFARRDQERQRFTWRHRVFIGLAALSLFAALRTWTTWRSFHRPVEVHAHPSISAAEQSAMIATIQARIPGILDPVAMNAATFQSVFLGRGRIERSVRFVREGQEIRGTVYLRDGGRLSMEAVIVWDFTFDPRGGLVKVDRDYGLKTY